MTGILNVKDVTIKTNNVQYGRLYVSTVGTTSATGYTYLFLGNETATGSANNSQGRIRLYGNNKGYTTIIPGYNGTSDVTLTLPNTAGKMFVEESIKYQTSSIFTGTTASYDYGVFMDLFTLISVSVFAKINGNDEVVVGVPIPSCLSVGSRIRAGYQQASSYGGGVYWEVIKSATIQLNQAYLNGSDVKSTTKWWVEVVYIDA